METIQELLAKGRQHFDNKEFQLAQEYLARVASQHPRYADVYNMLGVIAHAEGKFASAIDDFQKALEINPHYTEAILNLAVLFNDLGQYDKAKGLYVRLKARPGKDSSQVEPVLRGKLSNLHADIGDIYRSIGLYQHAIEEYRKALALNPAYFDIRTKLGQALREHGRLADSLAEIKAVLRANARYCPALIQLGITAYALQDTAEAKRAWKRTLEVEPENQYARMYLRLCDAIAVAERKRPPKATARAAAKPKKVAKRR
jgi:tetratricopeptide (TPR) repeat protein